jgi:Rad3-related DNA helicase
VSENGGKTVTLLQLMSAEDQVVDELHGGNPVLILLQQQYEVLKSVREEVQSLREDFQAFRGSQTEMNLQTTERLTRVEEQIRSAISAAKEVAAMKEDVADLQKSEYKRTAIASVISLVIGFLSSSIFKWVPWKL